jgi:DNA primase
VLVCEGLPDALIAAQAGHRASAVLGAGFPDDRVAGMLLQRFAAERLVVAFDADDRGRAGASRLVELLHASGARGRVVVLDVPGAWGDLNGWHLAAGAEFGHQLASAMDRAAPAPVAAAKQRTPEGLAEQLEAIHYRHVLVDDPVLAARNLARLRRSVAEWERTGTAGITRSAAHSPLEEDFETLAYRHLMADDPMQSQPNIAAVKAAVAEWSLGAGEVGTGRRPALRSAALGVEMPAAAPALERGLGIDL